MWFAAMVVFVLAMSGMPAIALSPGDSTGVVDQTTGIWYLRDATTGTTTSFYYGNPGDYPMVGDWDCNGIDTPGLYRQSDGYVYLRNSNTQGIADVRFFFGNPGDVPLPGDFNKDGCDTVSIYRPSEARIYVINKLGANDGGLGAADYAFYFGNRGDKAFTGDFNNNGQDTVGLHRESTGFVYYRDTLTTGIADNDFFYGDPGDQILTGRWVQDPTKGPETVGIFRPSNGTFYLRFENSQGNANIDYPYGNVEHGGGCRLLRHTAGRRPGTTVRVPLWERSSRLRRPRNRNRGRDLEREAIPGAVRRDRPHPDDVWVRDWVRLVLPGRDDQRCRVRRGPTGRNTC